MPVCIFCKKNYEFPRGITVVHKDGTVKYFCSSKCRKNSEMGRDNRKVGWVKKSVVAKAETERKSAEKIRLQEKVKKVKKGRK